MWLWETQNICWISDKIEQQDVTKLAWLHLKKNRRVPIFACKDVKLLAGKVKQVSWWSHQRTMGPPWHRGFRQLVESTMELNTCQTTQNCPPITNMTIFSRHRVHFSPYKSQKSELWNNLWKQVRGSRKVSTNRCSKTRTIYNLMCYWGYTLVDWNYWLHF